PRPRRRNPRFPAACRRGLQSNDAIVMEKLPACGRITTKVLSKIVTARMAAVRNDRQILRLNASKYEQIEAFWFAVCRFGRRHHRRWLFWGILVMPRHGASAVYEARNRHGL